MVHWYIYHKLKYNILIRGSTYILVHIIVLYIVPSGRHD